jgi:hypothetical protein
MLILNPLTRQAITHTRHCLTGCAIGEVLGMVAGRNMSNLVQTALAVVLAFFFGYLLTVSGAIKGGITPSSAIKLALAVDTVSIISMEIIDNTLEWLIPGAINSQLNQFLFWWSLAASLAVAFILTVPVNRLMIMKGIGHSNHH